MKKSEKKRIHRKTSLMEHLPRLKSTSDAPVKLIFVLLYLLGAVLVWKYQGKIAASTAEMPFVSPVAQYAMEHSFGAYLLIGGIAVTILIFYPLDRKFTQDRLKSIGLCNHTEAVPQLKRKYRDKENPKITVMEFTTEGIPPKVWEDKQAAIETVLDITIVQMKNGSGRSRMQLYTVPARTDLPEVIHWHKKYLPRESFALALGESFTGPVTVNLAKVPHVLLGGSTGSGKSVLLKLLLMQSVQKGAEVYIADFKGGVDFPSVWHEKCRICIDEASLVEILTELVKELEHRKQLLKASRQANIDLHNAVTGSILKRCIFACDEIAEVLDRTGLTKEQKEVVNQIESKLSMIARQGRAFGIHLILATQRPDANILAGQIRSNINCRICGRADNILSQIILDNTSAADQIPKYSQGRFILKDGPVFQAYWFDECEV